MSTESQNMSTESQKGISRRNFAKASAAASFAILSASKAKAANNDTLKVGLLGCGNRGSGAASQMLLGNENVQLVALADLFQDKIDEKRKKFEEDPRINEKVAIDDDHCFVGFDAYKKILKTDIDIIIEGSLPYSRPKHLEAAVNAKKHIFTEKPISSEPHGIRQVLAAAEKHKKMGLSFVAGTQRRHQKEYVETMDKIHNGAIGDIMALRTYWCGTLPFVRRRKPGMGDFEYRIRNWINNCWVNGDNIVEQHIHNIDVANWVMNDHPAKVYASGGRNWKPLTEEYGDQYDHFSCDFEYANGVHLTSMCRHWDGTDNRVYEEAVGTKRTIRCHELGERATDPYVQEHIDLVASIRGTGPYLHEAKRVAESTMTSIMGRISAYTGKEVTWDEALNSEERIVPEVWSLDLKYPVGPIPNPVPAHNQPDIKRL